MLTLLLSTFVREHLLLALVIILLPLPLRAVEAYLRRWRLSSVWGCQKPASSVPVADPVVGLDFVYRVLFGRAPARYLDSTWRAFRELGATYTETRWTWSAVYTCDAQNLKQVLATGSQDFGLPGFRTSVIGRLFGQGIFVLSGGEWRHARTVLRRNLKKDDPAPFLATLEKHFAAFRDHIPTDGQEEVDLQPLFLALAMDVSTEFLMGHSTHMLDTSGDHAREQQFVDDYMVCSEEMIQRMQLGPLHPFKINLEAGRAKKRVYKYLGDFIDASLREAEQGGGEKKKNLLLDMMDMAGDRKGVSDQILHILLASRDTTSSLMSNLFFMLAKKPDAYAKLREEVLSVAGENPPTASQLKEMRYLKWCVNECKPARLIPHPMHKGTHG